MLRRATMRQSTTTFFARGTPDRALQRSARGPRARTPRNALSKPLLGARRSPNWPPRRPADARRRK
eukprot:11225252-Lingulodinium_polyedra.AAC.1